MSNLTDALIAAKLIGTQGGGSGGGSGLPEIEMTESTTPLIASQSVSFTQQGDMYMGVVIKALSIVVGDTVQVTWDGTSYVCPVFDFEGLAGWGNMSILGMGSDTGEPFLMYYGSEGGTSATEMSTTLQAGASHTIALDKVTLVQSPPDGYVLMVVDGEWKAAPLP